MPPPSRTFKITHLLLAVLFLIFALLQLNDPDPVGWTLGYLAIAASCTMAFFGYFPKGWLWAVTIGFGIWMLLWSPGIVRWAQQGFPNITGAMQAETPVIEDTREFLGLLLGFVLMLSLALRTRRRVSASANEQ